MTSSQNVIETFELRKVFNETKVAVEGLTLNVREGEVFGFLGPNGAGKTTSIKMLLGLVKPTAGSGLLMGKPVSQPDARRSVGFLPEHFRFHEWMRADEFLDIHGQLYGMSRADRQERAAQLIRKVDLDEAVRKPLRTFSKGMLQRVGLAMALLPRPKIVFLDEPTSGLDPFGRLLVRDIIRDASAEGTTVFLNSHLLSEVEVTCTRVAFIRKGRVVRSGSMAELNSGLIRAQVQVEHIPDNFAAELASWGEQVSIDSADSFSLTVQDLDRLAELNAWMVGQGMKVFRLAPKQVSLDEIFVQIIQSPDERGA